MEKPVVRVIFINGKYFVNYAQKEGKIKLLTADGIKVEITEPFVKPRVHKRLEVKKFKDRFYFKSKLGVFSCLTGRKINTKAILKLFQNHGLSVQTI